MQVWRLIDNVTLARWIMDDMCSYGARLWEAASQCLCCLCQGSGPFSSSWSTPVLSSLLLVHGLHPSWAMTTQRDLDMVSEGLKLCYHSNPELKAAWWWHVKSLHCLKTLWKHYMNVSPSSNNLGLGREQDGLTNAGAVTAVPVNAICLISVKTLPYFPFKV